MNLKVGRSSCSTNDNQSYLIRSMEFECDSRITNNHLIGILDTEPDLVENEDFIAAKAILDEAHLQMAH